MKREMTAELREKLAGLLPFSEDARDKFTPSSFDDIPTEYKPVFELRTLTRDERRKARAIVKKAASDASEKTNDDLKELARSCVMGWENLLDLGTLDEIEYDSAEGGGADRTKFLALGETTIGKLLMRVLNISGLLDLERLSLR